MTHYVLPKATGVEFVVKNNSSRAIKIFTLKIQPGQQADLLDIRFVSEGLIKYSLQKGRLFHLLDAGDVEIVSTSIDLGTTSPEFAEFLRGNGAPRDNVEQRKSDATEPHWYIDPVNGKDNHKGTTAAKPLKTHEELRCRIGDGVINQTTTVHLLNDFDASNPVYVDFRLGPNGYLKYAGEKPTTILASGTFTGVTPISTSSNQAQEVEDTALSADWGTLGLVNSAFTSAKRIRIVGGPNFGGQAWACKDLGSKTARTSAFSRPPSFFGFGAPPPLFRLTPPNIGDPYVVESGFTKIAVFTANIKTSPIPVGSGFAAQVLFVDLELENSSPNFKPWIIVDGARGNPPSTIFSACACARLQVRGGNVGVEQCRVDGGSVSLGAGEYATSLFFDQTFVSPNARAVFIAFSMYQDGTLNCLGGNIYMSDLGLFDSSSSGAIVLAGGSLAETFPFSPGPGSAAVFGSGNDGYGVDIGAGAVFLYEPNDGSSSDAASAGMTVTGADGDFRIAGGAPVNWASASPDYPAVASPKLAGVIADT